MLDASNFIFFHDPPATEIYTLSLHDALPISATSTTCGSIRTTPTISSPETTAACGIPTTPATSGGRPRSEEHTSELQSHSDLVCRLLLEKKNKTTDRWWGRNHKMVRSDLHVR